MSETRIYLNMPLKSGELVELSIQAARHVKQVLRLRTDAPLVVFNGQGGEFDARIREIRGRSVTVYVENYRDAERELTLDLRLVQGVSRNERMDWTIRKAVELGAARIDPVFTVRSVVRLDRARTDKRWQHWQGIAISACEQCGGNRIPTIGEPMILDRWMADQMFEQPGVALLLQPGTRKQVRDVEHTAGPITFLIGPEGGLTPKEAEQAIDLGFTPVSLGPRILRTETAAVAALAMAQSLWG